MFNRKIWAMCLVTLTVMPRPAFAQYQTRSQVVSFGDLDISTKPGMRKLDERIAKAAYDVCRDGPDISIDIFENMESCVARARTVSRTQIAERLARRVQTASR